MLINIINIGIFLIALLHVWFCILEMFLWQKPLGLKIFKITPEFAHQSAPLAANQGLYNLFLSAGLFWSLLTNEAQEAWHIKLFFLTCVALAGLFGGVTVSKRIFMIQALPAIIILVLMYIAYL